MVDGDNSPHVTRREFYGALVVVWLYIMLVLGDLLRVEQRWTTGLLWAASLFMVVGYVGCPGRVAHRAGRAAELGRSVL